MPFYPRRRSVRKTKAPTRKYAKRVYKKRPSLVKTIKKVLHSQVENKKRNDFSVNLSLAYAGSITNPTYINLTPNPLTGTSVTGRIGNQIRVVKGLIRGYVNVLPYNATTNTQVSPIMVKMWLCARVQTNSATPGGGVPGTNDFANFFQTGSSSAGFQSNMLDMLLYPNTDYWKVYATKTMTLQNGYYSGATAPTTAVIGSNYAIGAPFSFRYEKHLGLCKFNDNSSFPQNKELFLVFQPVYADGSSSMSALTLAECHYTVDLEYEDA